MKYFVKVAELLSFSRASKALYITQSTLSQQIKQLEDELDMALFYRTNHKVSLTEAGETFLEGAKKTLAEADDNKAKIMDLASGHRGTLNIGVTHSFGSILTESVLAFKKQFPDVHLNICYRNVAELMELVSEGELDFALSFRSYEKFDNVESRVLFHNKLCIIVREDHPLTRKDCVRLADLEGYELILVVDEFICAEKSCNIHSFCDIVAIDDFECSINDFNFAGPFSFVALDTDLCADCQLFIIFSGASHVIEEVCAVFILSVNGSFIFPPALLSLNVCFDNNLSIHSGSVVLGIGHNAFALDVSLFTAAAGNHCKCENTRKQ